MTCFELWGLYPDLRAIFGIVADAVNAGAQPGRCARSFNRWMEKHIHPDHRPQAREQLARWAQVVENFKDINGRLQA